MAITPKTKSAISLPVIEEKVNPDSIVYIDACCDCNVQKAGALRHHRLNHPKLFAGEKNQGNTIERFWNLTRLHLKKFNGIKSGNFYWFLKECEWRFNGCNHQQLLQQLGNWYENEKH